MEYVTGAAYRDSGGGGGVNGHGAGATGETGNPVAIRPLLVIYHVIRRWMLIQRRRLAF